MNVYTPVWEVNVAICWQWFIREEPSKIGHYLVCLNGKHNIMTLYARHIISMTIHLLTQQEYSK